MQLPSTQFIKHDEYSSTLKHFILDLNVVLNKKNYFFEFQADKPFFSNDILNLLFRYKGRNKLEKVIKNMIIESCLMSKNCGGDERITAEFTVRYLNYITSDLTIHNVNIVQVQQKAAETVKFLKNAIKQHIKHLDLNALQVLLHQYVNDNKIASIVFEAFLLAGIEGKIILEKSKFPQAAIELSVGNNFKINTPSIFYDATKKWKYKNVRCLLIDGMIEQVSEIHGLLEKAAETKEPIVFLCRGYGDEVLSTIHVNRVRNTLNIMPLLVPSTLDGINILNDMAAVCGCDIVSSLKGQFISTVQYNDLCIVDSIVCNENSVIITNTGTENTIFQHINELIQKKNQQTGINIRQLYDERIKALASTYVTISIPDSSKTSLDETFEKLEFGIRMLRSVISRGSIDIDDIVENLNEQNLDMHIVNALKTLHNKNMPTNVLLAVLEFGVTNALLMAHSAGALIYD